MLNQNCRDNLDGARAAQRALCLALVGFYLVFGVTASVSARDFWVDATAKSNGDGRAENPFQKIQQAAHIAKPGDTVRVRPGIYRERVMPEHGGEAGKPIIYRSEEPLGAVVKGSDVWTPEWRNESAGIFSGALDENLFTDTNYVDGGNPFRIAYDWDKSRNHLPPTPYKSVNWTLGQVFADGQMLNEMSSRDELRRNSGAWWYDAVANRILLRLANDASPQKHMVEITTRRGVFRPQKNGLGYIELHGFVFEHCANQFTAQFWKLAANAQSGMVGTRGGHHWLIASNVFQFAKSVGLTFGRSGSNEPGVDDLADEFADESVGFHRIVGNLFRANGAVGAMGNGHTDVVFERNVFTGNNALLNNAYETGGLKTHQATRMVVTNNWLLDNETQGIWLDNTWRNCRITRNIFAGNRGKDIFFEMNDSQTDTASLVDFNLFLPGRPVLPVAGRTAPKWQAWSAGIYAHDADGVRITHNLFAGEGYGLYLRKITKRKGGAAFFDVTKNIFAGEKLTAVCLAAENPPFVRSNFFDANIYPAGKRPFVATGWSAFDGKVDADALERLLNRAEKKSVAKHPFGRENIEPSGYFLTLDEWRTGMGFDRESIQADIACEFDRKRWTLNLNVPERALELSKKSNNAPGPFEELKPGRQSLPLPRPDEFLLKRSPENFYANPN
jgi:hypothetical protein